MKTKLNLYTKYSERFPNTAEETWGYKEPEKVKIEYIMARNDAVEQQINITDEEMHKYYENKSILCLEKKPKIRQKVRKSLR